MDDKRISKPERILIITNSLNIGGAETFTIKMFRAIDKERYVFDYLVCDEEKGYYEKEIEGLSGKVFHGYPKSKHLIKSLRSIYCIVKRYNYKTVLRLGEHPIVFLDLLFAKMAGAKWILARSTNTRAGGVLGSVLAYFCRPFLNLVVDRRIAPATEAGIWLFGKKMWREKRITILKNGLDIQCYRFNENGRKRIRDEFGLEDKKVLGHIGRFNEQKNHIFLLHLFKQFLKKDSSAVLILVGNGELKNKMMEVSKSLGIYNNVIFAGARTDIPDLMSAMDIFLFPSLYEGLPNVIVEAQASGLPCLISDKISPEVVLCKNVKQLPIDNDFDKWTEEISLNLSNRMDTYEFLKSSGYCIADVVEKFSALLEWSI